MSDKAERSCGKTLLLILKKNVHTRH